ncbi:SnoaL-like domain protein [Vibrio aerogenes CECT 7868]|uniref:SnoaL-like domain protein n=1 Tax=Vibrio aerogenes CECT 7868 TaxID=1216006 RepID=A0A1M5Z2R2_9VIBR|nr:nuclear transport factor 2 family protein [Vibrio aerogenes]SHI18418.1 SnoaL-like domain protein [Vibrio aerogenes CECT 7868]
MAARGIKKIGYDCVCAYILFFLFACTSVSPESHRSDKVTLNPSENHQVSYQVSHQVSLSSQDRQLAANKRLVYDMWRTLVDAHDARTARQYLNRDFIQHNPVIDTGRRATLSFFSALGQPRPVLPRVKAELIAIVAEKDLVALVQADRQLYPHPYTTTWFDLYRIKNNRIVEHWDHGKLPMGMMPAAYTPVKENLEPEKVLESEDRQLAANKQRIFAQWGHGNNPAYFAKNCIRHTPVPLHHTAVSETTFRPFVNMIAEGNLVVMATKATYEDGKDNPYTTTWFEMFRLSEGKVTEYWNTARLPVLPVANRP